LSRYIASSPRQHLRQILRFFVPFARAKYWKGHRDNGGYLWRKPLLLGTAMIEEATDQVDYAVTVRQQAVEVHRYLKRAERRRSWSDVHRAIEILEEGHPCQGS
jgi:hypothetical protein